MEISASQAQRVIIKELILSVTAHLLTTTLYGSYTFSQKQQCNIYAPYLPHIYLFISVHTDEEYVSHTYISHSDSFVIFIFFFLTYYSPF